jgi:DMSO/TMAO reductase YedYZ molybdopterin-dependent catalytic subunit
VHMMPLISRGFRGRPDDRDEGRLPPGQYLTPDFPVLSAGPTVHLPTEKWTFEIRGEIADPRSWTWEQFMDLPSERFTVDIHCVTKWSKLDTPWTGVSLDALLDGIDTDARHVLAFSDGGYTANLPLADVTDGKAWVAYQYEGEPLAAEHGGPARLLVPHLYFWKSAKWVRGIELRQDDQPGFWERYGYHNYGDPWKEQRYAGD